MKEGTKWQQMLIKGENLYDLDSSVKKHISEGKGDNRWMNVCLHFTVFFSLTIAELRNQAEL